MFRGGYIQHLRADAGNLCCAPKIPQRFTEIYKTCADIAVLRNREGKFGYMDCGGARLTGEGKLECVATLREGEVVFDPEARSMPDWQNAPAPYWTAPGTTRSWTLWK